MEIYNFVSPTVSIIMSVKDGEEFIEKSINSMINQSYSNFEFLIFNDGSRDNTLAILRSYKDSRIKVFSDTSSLGLATRLNFLINESVGEFIARMDADDISHPRRIEEQVNFLSQHKDVDAVDCISYSIDENNIVTGINTTALIGVKLDRIMLNGGLFTHGAVMAKSSWYKKNLYNENYLRAQDYELWCRTALSSTFARVPKPLFYYRKSENLKRNYLVNIKNYYFISKAFWLKVSPLTKGKVLIKIFFQLLYYYCFKVFGIKRDLMVKVRTINLDAEEKRSAQQQLDNILSGSVSLR
jgi:glycosyltransferase involved in cell wall biosynthesis